MMTGRYIHPGSLTVGSRCFMHHGRFIRGVPVYIALVTCELSEASCQARTVHLGIIYSEN
jgi:hypothetical protein